MDMRSRSVRDNIDATFKQARTQKNMQNKNLVQAQMMGTDIKKNAAANRHKNAGKSYGSFNSKQELPNGHEVWTAAVHDPCQGPTQWEAAITRDNA